MAGEGKGAEPKLKPPDGAGAGADVAAAGAALPLSKPNKFDAAAGFADIDAGEPKAGAETVLFPPPKS